MSNNIQLGPTEVLFKEGKKADKLYLIKRGSILCFKLVNDRLVPIYKAQEDDIIGESAIIAGVHTYSAITWSYVELVELPASNFTQILKTSPAWLSDLTLTMIDRFQKSAALVAENRIMHKSILPEEEFPSTLENQFKKMLSQ